jgi:hypothetical protein
MLVLLTSLSGHKLATATPGVEEHEVSQSGPTDLGKQGFTVRQLFSLSELDVADGCMVMNRPGLSSRP